MESPIIAKLPRGHRMDRQFGVVYENAPAHADDLTQIDGIRTREAVLLNQRGIYLFGQIALWRHREIVEIAGELHVPVSRILDEGWVDQARDLSRPAVATTHSDLPASMLRTVTLLACALLIGFFTIYFFGQHRNQPLTGVLSADITSIRVPVPSRLTAVHVKPGQEVFSGQPLLTLEKLEHLAMIETQERAVRKLEMDLKRAEAQAKIEMEWRSSDLDRNLASVKQQIAHRQTGVLRQQQERTASAVSSGSSLLSVSPISARSTASRKSTPPIAGGLMFFSGSGQTSPVPVMAAAAKPTPVRTAMALKEGVVSDSPEPLVAKAAEINDPELNSMISEELRLQTLRESLPETVREAMGVTSLKGQLDEAAQYLETMRSVSRDINVTAPVYGVVGQVRYRQGDDLPNGEIMLRILHTDRRYIVVHLPTRRVNEMQPGHEVELVFPGQQEFRGQIVEVPMLADSTCQSGDTLAAVRIEPAGRLWPMIPVGSQVDVISLKQ
jgi:multidrug resistance efflux pump